MPKYTVYQQGGDNADFFNQYADQMIANQQQTANYDDYNPASAEEDDSYIQSLRDYDTEQEQKQSSDDLNSKFDRLLETVNQQLAALQSQKQEYDWFESDAGNDYLAGTYNTQQQSDAGEAGKNNYGNIRGADGNFASYATPEAGRMALINQLSLYQTGKTKNPVKPSSSLYEAMAVYAPASDNNNPKHYAEFVAKQLGVSPNTPISKINTDKWADAITQMEGNKNIDR
jgi:hypothetical protein